MSIRTTAVVVCAIGLVLTLTGSQAMARGASAGIGLRQAEDIVVSKILGGSLGGRRVYSVSSPVTSESTVRGWRKEVAVPFAEAWFLYVDLYPQANWEHPTHYIFVERQTGDYRIIEAMTPPELYVKGQRVFPEEISASKNQPPSSGYRPPSKARLSSDRLSVTGEMDQLMRNAAPEHLWAVVMNGGYDRYNNHTRYWNDLSDIYTTLTKKYGYLDSQIIVLCSDGTDPAPDRDNNTSSPLDLDHDGDNDIEYASTYSNLVAVLTDLQTRLTPDDLFFFYATDHGGQISGHIACMYLWNQGDVIDTTFARLTGPIPSRHKIYCLEPCFSGGFVDDLNRTGEIVAAACDWDEYSWACDTEGDFDEFVYHWTGAVRRFYPYSSSEPWRDGTAVNADVNNDSQISMKEAFDYALAHDSQSEAPQYLSTPALLGHLVTLGDIPPLTNLVITLVPDTYPIVIPPEGGSFGFTATVQNQASIVQTMHAWTQADVPGQGTVAALGPRVLTIPAGGTRTAHYVQTVPATAPSGTYSYCGCVGVFTESQAASDCFDVIKQ